MKIEFNHFHRLLLSGIIIAGSSSGCKVAATRPTQEMYNAGIALKAAKDLNADSLMPELYRKAADYYFKSKQEYRLKNFDNSKKLALLATKTAEEAEFESYRLGGATPEIQNRTSTQEGAMPDDEAEFQNPEDSYDRELPSEYDRKGRLKKKSGEPSLDAEHDPNFAPIVSPQDPSQKETPNAPAQSPAAPSKETIKPPLPPQGQTGPDSTSDVAKDLKKKSKEPKVNAKPVTISPDRPFPQTGSLPNSIGLPNPEQVDLTPKPDSPKLPSYYEGAKEPTKEIENLETKPIENIPSHEITQLGTQPNPEKNSLDEIDVKPLPELDSIPLPDAYPPPKKGSSK